MNSRVSGSRRVRKDRLQGELGEWQALRHMGAYLFRMRGILILAFTCTVIHSSIGLGWGRLAKGFIDLLQRQGGSGQMAPLAQYIGLAAGLLLLKALVYLGMGYGWAYAAQQLGRRLRNDLFHHLHGLSPAYFDRRKTGQLISLLTNDVTTAASVVDRLQDLGQTPVSLIGGIGLLFYINWPLALLSLVVLPIVGLVISRAKQKVSHYSRQLMTTRSMISDLAQENLAGIRAVQSFGNEAHEIRRFARRGQEMMRTVLKTVRLKVALGQGVDLLSALTLLLVIYVGTREIVFHPGQMTFGSLAWFVIVLQQVTSAAQDAGSLLINTTGSAVAADRIFTFLRHPADIQEKPGALALPRLQGRVEFADVSFAYSSGIPVLEGISFTVAPGEVVAVVGPTGAGKTTIASLVPRFYDVTRGAIRVDGIDIRDCTLKSLRRQIGIVPQDTSLFAGTLKENIAYGRLGATDAEIEQAAKRSNAWEFIERLPQGLETAVGERGVRLSGGQRQRIAIARAILRDPRLLILDEATSSLDSQSEALVQEALGQLVQNRTTLVIAHRLSTIRNADRILVLRDGRIAETGRHADLLARGGVYADLYRTQYRESEPADACVPA